MSSMWNKSIRNGITFLSSWSWMPYLWLALITLFAAMLRFYKLGAWSFWIDEIYTVNHAAQHFSTLKSLVENIPPARNWIPLSVILTAQAFNLWGVNELNARLVAAIIGVITIPVLYFPIKKIFNTRIALITVLLLAVSPWHLEWSQNARGYTSLLLFYSLALFALYFWIEKDRITYFFLFFVFLYLASSERLISILILPVILVYLLILRFLPFEKPPGLRIRNLIMLLSPLILLGVYQAYNLIQNGESVIDSIFSEIISAFLGRSIENPITQTIFIIFNIGIPVFALSLSSGLYTWLHKSRHGLLFFIGAVIPFGVIAILTPFMFTEERYVFVTLPSWLVLTALGIEALWVRFRKYETVLVAGILLVLLADAMGTNLLYFHNNHGNRRDWKEAFAIVQANMHTGDVVVSTWPVLGNYYLRQDVLQWESVDENTVIEYKQRVWFVVIPDMAWFTGTQDFYWWVSHNTRLIKTLYLRTVDNANLEIYLFDPAIDITLDSLK